MADFWLKHKGQYPRLAQARLPAFNWCGLLAYALGSVAAYSSPLLPPVVGVAVAVLAYAVLLRLPLASPALAVKEG
ncbi:MAG: hypothetical protein LRY38_08710 [Aeromonadaceae bacterium]|nr:hypothetical protein [Aeromonadaceae bacterium]